MTKTNYATESNVDVLIEGLTTSVSETLMAYALTTTDLYIEREVGTQDKVNTPSLVMQAAEYKAAELIYRKLYKNSEGSNPTAVWLASEADKFLASFVKGGAQETSKERFSHSSSNSFNYDERRESGYTRYGYRR